MLRRTWRVVSVVTAAALAAACSSSSRDPEPEPEASAAAAESTSGGVALFHSDSCAEGDLLAAIGPMTNCTTLASHTSSSVWAVRFGGHCYDISDVDVTAACKRYKGGGAALFHSDRCETSDLIGLVGASSECNELASVVTSSVWGVMVDGQCNDISDTNALSACQHFSGGPGDTTHGPTTLYHSDSCSSSDVVGAIGPGTDCAAFGSQVSSSVWGVKIDGACYDIRDDNARAVCDRYKGGGAQIFHSDSCAAGDLLAAVGPGSDCAQIASSTSSSAWGIRVNGTCYDISDVDIGKACTRFKGGSAAFFHSDRCESGDLLAVVGGGTDCQALGAAVTSSVWAVMIDGQCTDISDTDMTSACIRYGGN